MDPIINKLEVEIGKADNPSPEQAQEQPSKPVQTAPKETKRKEKCSNEVRWVPVDLYEKMDVFKPLFMSHELSDIKLIWSILSEPLSMQSMLELKSLIKVDQINDVDLKIDNIKAPKPEKAPKVDKVVVKAEKLPATILPPLVNH